VVRLEGGKLMLNTEFAGEISIQADKVTHLTLENPVPAHLLDGTRREAAVFYRQAQSGEKAQPAAEPLEGTDLALVENINVKPKPRIRFKGRVNAGITNDRGNTDTDQYHLDAEIIARMDKHRLTIGGVINDEKSDGTTTVNNWKGYGKYDYFILPKWFLYGSSLFEHDEFADLDLRTTLGAGVGHQFFDSEELNLSASAGVAYISEDFIVAEDDDYPGGQWIVQYDQYFFNKRLQLFHSNNGYISFEDSNQWEINTSQGVRIPLIKGFVSTLQYDYDYNNKPSPEAASKWDSKFMFLLGYQFGN
jgi:putative salt-induced outer membrane protein YdiY